jgi:glycosyltransferase involved in cell wall biosynthesis
LVRSLLESLARCEPQAGEILVVDQSEQDDVALVVDGFAHIGARVVRCETRGRGLARNVGLREAVHDIVLATDDDCTVAPDWVGRGWKHVNDHPGRIATGSVLPVGSPEAVPSTKDEPLPRDYTGDLNGFPLFTNNVALNRRRALDLGGFDEGLPAAEDNDFGYRWRLAGLELVYDPSMVVWHHDWRTPEELERLYRIYARGQAAFYAKHLRRGDLRMLYFMGCDLAWGCRGLAARLVRGRPEWPDPRPAVFAALPLGLAVGWRAYKPGRNAIAELSRLGTD